MTLVDDKSPIPAPAQAVLDLFKEDLAGVRFPDMDQAVLEAAAAKMRAAAEAEAQAEAALQAAREAFGEAQETLLHKCSRALSYARVYAEEDPDLSSKLDDIQFPRGGRGKAAPAPALPEVKPAARRGRRPQVSGAASGPALFIERAEPETAVA